MNYLAGVGTVSSASIESSARINPRVEEPSRTHWRETGATFGVIPIRAPAANAVEARRPRCALIIPTRNAGSHLDRLLPALAGQTLQPDELLVVDSQSTDDTVARFRAFGARVEVIDARSFNHGGTRRWAAELTRSEVLIFMTQDAIPAVPQSLQRLYEAVLADREIGVAYGRQLPQPRAGLLAAHARLFNYPQVSRRKRLGDAAELGIKTCFNSDSFSAVRRSALEAIGGFPENVIGSEDAYVAGRMLLNGWTVNYTAEAPVYHSHDYSLMQEFRRYFDIGVFYGRERWIRDRFGSADREGRRFVISEMKTVIRAGAFWLEPEVLLRTSLKFLGYKLGNIERLLPRKLKRRLSLFPGYWA